MIQQKGEMMAQKDQESGEMYEEIEQYIEDIQAGHVAHPPMHATLEQMQIYRMAAFLYSALSDTVDPGAEFADALYGRLLAMKKDANTEGSCNV